MTRAGHFLSFLQAHDHSNCQYQSASCRFPTPQGDVDFPSPQSFATVTLGVQCLAVIIQWLCSVAQSCPTLCGPHGRSLPGSSVRGIFQARILEWLPLPTPGDIPYPGIKPTSLASPAFIGRFFTTEPPGKVYLLKQRNTTKLGKNNGLPEICFPVFIGYMAGQLAQ